MVRVGGAAVSIQFAWEKGGGQVLPMDSMGRANVRIQFSRKHGSNSIRLEWAKGAGGVLAQEC